MPMIVSQVMLYVFIYSHNLFQVNVIDVKESIADIYSELPCLGDLENLGQLPGSRGSQR